MGLTKSERNKLYYQRKKAEKLKLKESENKTSEQVKSKSSDSEIKQTEKAKKIPEPVKNQTESDIDSDTESSTESIGKSEDNFFLNKKHSKKHAQPQIVIQQPETNIKNLIVSSVLTMSMPLLFRVITPKLLQFLNPISAPPQENSQNMQTQPSNNTYMNESMQYVPNSDLHRLFSR